MIRAGREVWGRFEVGAAHGLSESLTERRRPWTQRGHPGPVNRPGGRRPGLWDRAQVQAFVAGEPVPEPPTVDSPNDLLDASEAAALAGIELTTWLRYDERERGMVPDPDALLHGQKHYRLGTLVTWLANRPGRGAGSGRRPKNGASESELRARTTELVAAADTEGRRLSARALARALGVSPAKAGKLLVVAPAK